MNYEEKYKEALERAKKFEEKYGGDYAGYIFPELAESEDERIRRTLVEYFGPSAQLDFIRGVPIKKIRDWLEKQKEQKPWKVGANAYFTPEQKQEWSEEDERILKGIIGKIDHDQTYGVSKVEMLSFLGELRPSWKPSEEHLSALLAVFNDPNNIGSQTCQLALSDLYEQLKKL